LIYPDISSIGAAITALVIVAAYAGLSGLWVDNSSGWYDSLKKPFWQPPNFVFGIIWPYNFVVLAFAGVQISLNNEWSKSGLWLLVLVVSVVFAIAWSWDFYKTRNLFRSAIWLGACALTTVGLLVQVSELYPPVFWWLVPYQIWLIVACSLAAGYAHLNSK
jgi:tryptophan-rich sensory protein